MRVRIWEKGSTPVKRGGSWFSYAQGCRAAYRSSLVPGFRTNYNGFRLTRRIK